MITLAKAYAQAREDAIKDGSWAKMTNSPEFIENLNKEWDKEFGDDQAPRTTKAPGH